MIISSPFHQTMETIQTEFEIIEQAKRDPEKFGRLYAKYYEKIFTYVNKKVNCLESSADIVSQVFFKAFINLHKYEFKGVPFGSWLFRIAKSELYQYFREQSKIQYSDFQSLDFALFFDSYEQEETDANIERLKKCLAKLNKSDSEIIVMRFYQKMPFKEIGDLKNMSENNAKVKCFRAISKLKNYYFG